MLGVSNSNATMKFVQLQKFYHNILGEQKTLVSSPVQKLVEHVPP